MESVDVLAPTEPTLSYDDTVAYEEQLPTEAERAAADAASFASRISKSKVYLLSESSAAKRKRGNDGEEEANNEDEDLNMDDDADLSYRANAILFRGSPIANLPTARLFAYATQFDAKPMGLEWVDDETCVFVFSSRKDAKDAFTKLTKPAHTTNATTEDGDNATMAVDDPMDPDYTLARPFPMALWPPEERINQTLGKGEGLKGAIHMRWAKVDDVKKRGAKRQSQFYRKHGQTAGKELFNGRDLPPAPVKRKRESERTAEDDERRRRELDAELDDFLAEDDRNEDNRENGHRRKRTRRRSRSASRTPPSSSASPPRRASPPSKMRSDYIADDGKSLLQRTSLLRFHPTMSDPLDRPRDLASRLIAPLPRRGRGSRGRNGTDYDMDEGRPSLQDRMGGTDEFGRDRRGGHRHSDRERERGRERPQRGERTAPRPRKTQQELDDELDAFLKSGN